MTQQEFHAEIKRLVKLYLELDPPCKLKLPPGKPMNKKQQKAYGLYYTGRQGIKITQLVP